jgi:hypothetical protein
MQAQAICHVDGLKMASNSSTNWPKKFTKTTMSMEGNLTRTSRRALRKKWPAPTKAGKRKRNFIETYNALNQAELIMNKDDENGEEEQEEGDGCQKMCS